jgi:hypothetical protein
MTRLTLFITIQNILLSIMGNDLTHAHPEREMVENRILERQSVILLKNKAFFYDSFKNDISEYISDRIYLRYNVILYQKI